MKMWDPEEEKWGGGEGVNEMKLTTVENVQEITLNLYQKSGGNNFEVLEQFWDFLKGSLPLISSVNGSSYIFLAILLRG